jgi:quinol-cytochrome oxidoreductase complex cytochrome b subunit
MDETTPGRPLQPGDARHPDTDRMCASHDGVLEHDREAEWQGQPTIRRFPDLLVSEATAMVLLLCAFTALCIFAPAHLGVRANPAVTPIDSTPAWYFLFLDQLLNFVPPLLGALAPIALLTVLGAWPFLDRNPSRQPRKRVFALALAAAVIVAILVLTIRGILE